MLGARSESAALVSKPGPAKMHRSSFENTRLAKFGRRFGRVSFETGGAEQTLGIRARAFHSTMMRNGSTRPREQISRFLTSTATFQLKGQVVCTYIVYRSSPRRHYLSRSTIIGSHLLDSFSAQLSRTVQPNS